MHLKTVALAALFSALTTLAAPAETGWNQFRGPRFDNVFDGQHLAAEFGPDKNVAWKTALPSGNSSPVIVGNRIFLTGFSTGLLEILCVNRSDGAVAWRKPVKVAKLEPYFDKFGTPAASTCATDGERVVSYFGSFGLLCHSLDGQEQWTVPLPLPQTKDGFGTGTSPIIRDGRVYLLRDEDGPGQGLYAFDVKTGKQLWKRTREGFRVSFGSPVVWDGSLVVIGDLRIKGYDLKTGADRWVVRGLAAYPCTTPAVGADGNLYVDTWSNGSANEQNMPPWDVLSKPFDKDGDGRLTRSEVEGSWLADFFSVQDSNKDGFFTREEWEGSLKFMGRGKNVVLAIKPGGHGDVTDTHVLWSNERGATYVSSPLAYRDRLYLAKDGGFLTTHDTKTGQVVLNKERLGVEGDIYSSPIAADGKVIIASQRGKVVIIKAGDALEVLHIADFGEAIAATPALVDNTLYLRTAGHLYAFREDAR